MSDDSAPAHKSLADWEKELGETIVNRAEILAAMDCLMHHLKSDREGLDDLDQWKAMGVRNGNNWNILDWDPAESEARTSDYVALAKSMSDKEFECVVYSFASIVKGQCFYTRFQPGRFE